MKRFFKNLLFGVLLCITPITKCSGPAGLGIADAFKDLSEAELVKAIEESQKALEDLLNNGTPEQKAEFEKALTELAENLSPDDWKELQAIGEVYEKNHPYVPQEASKEPVKEKTAPIVEKNPEAKAIPEKTKMSHLESSIKETLELIIKNIDHMFHILSAHRDLSHKLKLWEEKSSFHELKSLLIRLKKHLNRLAKTSDPENKLIIDNLQAFKKDLEAENKKIALAQDDFGLENPMTSEQADHTLTRVTLVLSTGINNLLPLLTDFFKKYEPEALEEAKKKDAQKAKAKDHEKNAAQRRPSSPYFSTAPSRTSGYDSYNHMPHRRHRPSDMNNNFNQNGSAKNASQKDHKADFGGFDMNLKRGTIQNGKAIPNPEKKKDDKDKKDGDKKDKGDDDSDKKDGDKKSEPKKIELNTKFIPETAQYISKNLNLQKKPAMLNTYPEFKDAPAQDEDEETKALYSAGKIDEFNTYKKNIDSQIVVYSNEIEDILNVLNRLQSAIGKPTINQSELAKFASSQTIKELEAKAKQYEEAIKTFDIMANQTFAKNIKTFPTQYASAYSDIHKQIAEATRKIIEKITTAQTIIRTFKTNASLPPL